MKTLIVSALIGITGLASAAPMTGHLESSHLDGNTGYRCQLAGGKGYVIEVGLNTDQRLLSLKLGGALTYPKDSALMLSGHYVEADFNEATKAPKKSYELAARNYDLRLTFTEGMPMPILNLVWGAADFICQ